MRASRSKKRAVDARRTQKRGGAGRARKAGTGPLKRPAKAGGKLSRAGQGEVERGDVSGFRDRIFVAGDREQIDAGFGRGGRGT